MHDLLERIKKSRIARWFLSLPTGRKGGVIGVSVCLFFFLVYYFTILFTHSSHDLIYKIMMFLLLFVGHGFLIFVSLFFKEGFMCTRVGECSLRIGKRCTEVHFVSLEPCAHITRLIGIWSFVLFLFVVYYFLGAGIAVLIEQRKSNNQ